MVDLLYNANVKWLDLGLQTTNPALKWIRNNNLQVMMDKFQVLRKANINFNVDLIFGIPGDSPESMIESLRFVIEDVQPTTLKVFPLRVYPGTALHDLALSKGAEWLKYNMDTCLVIETDLCNQRELKVLIKLSNTIVSMYRYFTENNWFDKEVTCRSLTFFKRLYKILAPLEFSDPNVWHILNCPQNAYDANVCSQAWKLYLSFSTRS